MALADLPFNLIDPIDGSSLEYSDSKLTGPERTYKVHTIHNTELINFHPDIAKQEGAYTNQDSEIQTDNIHPSNTPIPNNYKDIELKRIFPYIPDNGIIADVGCGSCELLHKIPESYFRIGIDISPAELFDCAPNALDSNVSDIWICNARQLPLPDNSIDCILLCDIVEHMLEPADVLAEARRVLKPGGIVFISVPNLVALGNRFSFAIGDGRGLQLAQILKGKNPFLAINGPRFPDQTKHLRWFTKKSLQHFVKDNGFTIKTTFGIGPIISRIKLSGVFPAWSHLIGIIASKGS